ncbi:MAG: hypothetical protein EZS28_028179, partial [Streblomastix strix]
EKNNVVVTGASLGTALVCVCMIILKYLRDQPYMNSWWAKTFGMDLQTLTESEVVILQLIDWELGMSDNRETPRDQGRGNFQEDFTDYYYNDYGSEVPVFGVECSFCMGQGKHGVVDFDQSIELDKDPDQETDQGIGNIEEGGIQDYGGGDLDLRFT